MWADGRGAAVSALLVIILAVGPLTRFLTIGVLITLVHLAVQIRPCFDCYFGTFRPSCRQIRSQRFLVLLHGLPIRQVDLGLVSFQGGRPDSANVPSTISASDSFEIRLFGSLPSSCYGVEGADTRKSEEKVEIRMRGTQNIREGINCPDAIRK
jgi:hypothetical protein